MKCQKQEHPLLRDMIGNQSIARLISGKLSKKYRAISRGTGLCRRILRKISTKKIRPDSRIRSVKQLALDVEEFMSREDNGRMQPGKGDAIKSVSGLHYASEDDSEMPNA